MSIAQNSQSFYGLVDESVVFGCGRFRTFRPGLGFGQRYHVDRHGQLALKQLRLSVLNGMHTNSYTGPRLNNFPKMSLLKVENFQPENFFHQNFFPTENLCRPITFYTIFFLREIFLSGNGP
jgi:hypothetical protein